MDCPWCGSELVKRHGKYGMFYGCSNYPDCTYTRNINENNNYEYGEETYNYIESQTLRKWNPSMKKWRREKDIYSRYDDY